MLMSGTGEQLSAMMAATDGTTAEKRADYSYPLPDRIFGRIDTYGQCIPEDWTAPNRSTGAPTTQTMHKGALGRE